MTAAQQTALEQITEKMREHFDCAVLIFETDAQDSDDPKLHHLTYRVSGTFAQCLGLVRYAEHKMLTEPRKHSRKINAEMF